MTRTIVAIATAVLLTLSMVAAGGAQDVPPHDPGTICFAPTFWCWAETPAPVGTRCFCPSPYGPVEGITG
jgi:hypothetical protein